VIPEGIYHDSNLRSLTVGKVFEPFWAPALIVTSFSLVVSLGASCSVRTMILELRSASGGGILRWNMTAGTDDMVFELYDKPEL
jgi:hypothetical protein